VLILLDEGSSVKVVAELFTTDSSDYIDFIETSKVLVMTVGDAYDDARNRTARLGSNAF
jgi:hypothetical protein